MSDVDTSDFIISTTVMMLSTWKTYLGPAISGMFGFGYLKTLLINLIPALCSFFLAFNFSGIIADKLNFNTRLQDSKRLQNIERAWDSYGQYIAVFLAPVLIGVPIYALLARQSKQSTLRTYSLITISVSFWVSIVYLFSGVITEMFASEIAEIIRV